MANIYRKKIKKTHEHIHTDRYLITYADLITLLLGLFVILYASSQVDEKKYKAFAAAFAEYFKSSDSKALPGGSGVLQGSKNGIPEPILPPQAVMSMSDLYSGIEKNLNEYLKKGTLKVNRGDGTITIILPEQILFPSSRAEIVYEGSKILDSVAASLRNAPFLITVDGHTDSDPIKTFQFESNWHLSVARALNVGYKLIGEGVPEHNLSIRGFGENRPISDNTTADGKAQNRRVEITISELPPDAPSTKGYNGAEDSAGKKN